jgi:hypothetical protein
VLVTALSTSVPHNAPEIQDGFNVFCRLAAQPVELFVACRKICSVVCYQVSSNSKIVSGCRCYYVCIPGRVAAVVVSGLRPIGLIPEIVYPSKTGFQQIWVPYAGGCGNLVCGLSGSKKATTYFTNTSLVSWILQTPSTYCSWCKAYAFPKHSAVHFLER